MSSESREPSIISLLHSPSHYPLNWNLKNNNTIIIAHTYKIIYIHLTTHAVDMQPGNRKKRDSCGLYEWASRRYTSCPPSALKKLFIYTTVVCINWWLNGRKNLNKDRVQRRQKWQGNRERERERERERVWELKSKFNVYMYYLHYNIMYSCNVLLLCLFTWCMH